MNNDDKMDELKRLINPDPPPEVLCEELEAAKVCVDGQWHIHHRLLAVQNYKPAKNARYNADLRLQEEKAHCWRMGRIWHDYLVVHVKDFWPLVLEEIRPDALFSEWCEVVSYAWRNSDEMWRNQSAWLRIFAVPNVGLGLMNEKEREMLVGAQFPLIVYRGCLPDHVDGMCWTLNQGVAEGFKYEAGARGVVYMGRVARGHVVAYINRAEDEYEIIVLPGNVMGKDVI